MYADPNPAIGWTLILIACTIVAVAIFSISGMYIQAGVAVAVFAPLIFVATRDAIRQHRWIMETFHSDRKSS